jgi:glucokinase
MAIIAIDLGGTKLAAAIFSSDGMVIQKEILLLEKREGKLVGALIASTTKHLLRLAETSGHRVEAVGICVPGISYALTGRVWAPNIPGWDDYPLLEEMHVALGTGTVGVSIDSDRACYILGEVWRGAARGCRNAIFLAVGTGIGAGIWTDGRILRGGHDIAGAIGWSALDRPFKEKYVACGCFEYHASGDGIARVAREYLAADNRYGGILAAKVPSEITARDIFDAYDQHDPIAEKVIAESIEFWGMAAANLVSLFNPEMIIFGGGVFGPALRFIDAIMAEARKWAQPISIAKVRFERSLLGSDAGLYGAAYLAMQYPLNHS